MKIILLRVPGKNRKNPKCWSLSANPNYHRTDGPAVIFPNNSTLEWWENGRFIRDNDFNEVLY